MSRLARRQFPQQTLESVRCLDALPCEFVAAIDQHPQRLGFAGAGLSISAVGPHRDETDAFVAESVRLCSFPARGSRPDSHQGLTVFRSDLSGRRAG
jgi:hypothetical protein